MKLFTRICLIISLICVCVGAVCLGVGVALGSGLKEVWAMAGRGAFDVGNLHIGGWNLPYIIADNDWEGDDDWEDAETVKGYVSEQFLADQVSNIEIDIKYGAVYLTDSETNQIEITVDAPECNTYNCNLDAGTIEFKDKTPRYIWNAGFARNRDVTVTIAIPKEKTFDKVKLTTNAGTIEITHDVTAKEIDFELDAGELTANQIAAAGSFSVDVGAGNLEVAQFTAESLKVDCGVGKAELYGTVLEDAKAECGIGRIVLGLIGEEENYDYEISCGLGTVSLNGKHYSTLSTEKEIDHHTGNKISLDCGVGEIEVTVKEE